MGQVFVTLHILFPRYSALNSASTFSSREGLAWHAQPPAGVGAGQSGLTFFAKSVISSALYVATSSVLQARWGNSREKITNESTIKLANLTIFPSPSKLFGFHYINLKYSLVINLSYGRITLAI
jgi:hypothetical protein